MASVYAGSRDSALTAHGVLQTRRLGAHLAALPVRTNPAKMITMTHIFSSDLQRASLTASAIFDAQNKRDEGFDDRSPATLVKSADLCERDFRSGEGTRFNLSRDSDGGGRNAFADAESWDEMSVRAKRFIDQHLDRLLVEAGDEGDDARTVVVVAHGLILNVLLSSLLLRYTSSEMIRLQPPQLLGASSKHNANQLRVPWSNTGHLVIHALRTKTTFPSSVTRSTASAGDEASNIELRVVSINCTEHLIGLKKTRGGIGSQQFDPKQKTMEAFFSPSVQRRKRDGDA
ncbi:hypothetical protein SEPCBS57363_003284 [Sporothrix epigloea]|uniref:Phosphoglycerate mutase family protein n=1 Tax=Sporothrix epigloea TaxID=1892477 RepID=A0ABP0DKL0_9PEZI